MSTKEPTHESPLIASKTVNQAAGDGNDKRSVHKAIHLGSSFCLIFIAFSAAQNFQTSSGDRSDAASMALGVLYICFTVTNFIVAYIINALKPKVSLIVGALTYVAFVGTNISYNGPIFYACSALLGVGASVLWTAHGAFLTKCAAFDEYVNGHQPNSRMGAFNGIFWSIHQVNQFVGNLAMALLFSQGIDESIIFTVLTIVCGLGTLSLFFLQNPDPVPGAMVTEDAKPKNLFSMVSLLKDWRLQCMIPLMMFCGLSQTYFFGQFPPLIKDKGDKFFVLTVFGASDMIGSYLIGKGSDRFGRLPMIMLGTVLFLIVSIYLCISEPPQDQLWLYYIAAVLLGVCDAVFNTQAYALLGSFFSSRSEDAFANFKLFQAGSTAVAYIYRLYTSFLVQSIIIIGILGLGMLLLIPLASTIRESQRDKSNDATSPTSSNGSRSDDHNPLDVHVVG